MNSVPDGWSYAAVDFIIKVCYIDSFYKLQITQSNPLKRLGFNGVSEIKNHPWLKDFSWKDL